MGLSALNGIDMEIFYRASPPLDTNPTDWWKVAAEQFSRLAKLAQCNLCIPTTPVLFKNVFGLIMTQLHS